MFKLKLSSIVMALLVLSSCSKDDDANGQAQASASIEGKWQFTKEGKMTGNQEIITDYEHTSGCTKDYTEFLAGNVAKDHYFDNPGCQETIDTKTWVKNNNTLILTDSNQPAINAEILELTNTTLKVKFPLSGEMRVVIFTKI